MPILSVRGLTRDFRGFRAVDGVDLDVAEGSVHALVGPNGAGKTTLFNLMTGFLAPTAGRIEMAGTDITGLPPERIARAGMARSFQITSLFPQLSLREHVELALQAALSKRESWHFWRSDRVLRKHAARAEELLALVGLGEPAGSLTGNPAGSLADNQAGSLAGSRADSLAYGRKRALELALALALEPRVLLLDEPTAGMGAEDIDNTVSLIKKVRSGRTVVLVEHNMNVVEALADRVSVLQAGKVIAEGGYAQVRADERVIAAYLGSADAAD
jgi:branched-chain amino acid transport system ATP-binding protein